MRDIRSSRGQSHQRLCFLSQFCLRKQRTSEIHFRAWWNVGVGELVSTSLTDVSDEANRPFNIRIHFLRLPEMSEMNLSVWATHISRNNYNSSMFLKLFKGTKGKIRYLHIYFSSNSNIPKVKQRHTCLKTCSLIFVTSFILDEPENVLICICIFILLSCDWLFNHCRCGLFDKLSGLLNSLSITAKFRDVRALSEPVNVRSFVL